MTKQGRLFFRAMRRAFFGLVVLASNSSIWAAQSPLSAFSANAALESFEGINTSVVKGYRTLTLPSGVVASYTGDGVPVIEDALFGTTGAYGSSPITAVDGSAFVVHNTYGPHVVNPSDTIGASIIFSFPTTAFPTAPERVGAFVAFTSTYVGQITLSAYGDNNTLLETISVPSVNLSSWGSNFVGLEELAGIRQVRFSSTKSVGMVLDALRFDPGPNYVKSGQLVSAAAGGGVTAIGGTEATLSNVTTGGIFTSQYQTATSQDALQAALGAAANGITFGLVGQNPDGTIAAGSAVQFWDMHFTGAFTGMATVTLHYDPKLTGGVPPSAFQIWHFTDGNWVPVTNEIIDAVAHTITFSTDSFSPFILGVPEPSTFIVAAIGGLALLAMRRKR